MNFMSFCKSRKSISSSRGIKYCVSFLDVCLFVSAGDFGWICCWSKNWSESKTRCAWRRSPSLLVRGNVAPLARLTPKPAGRQWDTLHLFCGCVTWPQVRPHVVFHNNPPRFKTGLFTCTCISNRRNSSSRHGLSVLNKVLNNKIRK